ncbi:MAG: hypothetical protein ABSF44_14690 [Candidatus Bathyarchaeia archaeon]
MSKKEEFSVRKLLDGAPKPSNNYDKLYCTNKRYLTPTPGQPLWENCNFTAPKTLSGYEAYKEHWYKEHANEQEMAVRKVKSQVGDAYFISVDLVTKGGKLLEHLVNLDVHRFDANSKWEANVCAIAENVDLFAGVLRLDDAMVHLREQKKRADEKFGEGWDKQI